MTSQPLLTLRSAAHHRPQLRLLQRLDWRRLSIVVRNGKPPHRVSAALPARRRARRFSAADVLSGRSHPSSGPRLRTAGSGPARPEAGQIGTDENRRTW